MDARDFKDSNLYQTSPKVAGLLQELDLNTMVVSGQSSIPKVVQNVIACQAEKNA